MMFRTFWGRKFAILATIVTLVSSFAVLTMHVQAQTAVPHIDISSVIQNQTVTICTSNFPAEQSFAVTMGDYGSRGITGYFVTTLDSGEGGIQRYTFDIPSALHENDRIAIRLQSRQGFYSFNWFYNTDTLQEHC